MALSICGKSVGERSGLAVPANGEQAAQADIGFRPSARLGLAPRHAEPQDHPNGEALQATPCPDGHRLTRIRYKSIQSTSHTACSRPTISLTSCETHRL